MSTENQRIILIVVDPAQDKPIALERALQTASRTADNPDRTQLANKKQQAMGRKSKGGVQ